ncbi:hypothetical protein FKM82_024085 [Ascaphus truei]
MRRPRPTRLLIILHQASHVRGRVLPDFPMKMILALGLCKKEIYSQPKFQRFNCTCSHFQGEEFNVGILDVNKSPFCKARVPGSSSSSCYYMGPAGHSLIQ